MNSNVNSNIDKYCLWQKITSYALLSVFAVQFTMPVYAVTEVISDDKIYSDLSSTPQFIYKPTNDYQYQADALLEAKEPQSFMGMSDFFNTLLAVHPSALDSIRKFVPIFVGDITTIIPVYPIEQQVGDDYVQSRYIRSQVIQNLNRLFIDGTNILMDTEGKQSNILYSNAIEFAKTSGKKFGERLTENDNPMDDILWPEYRFINGKRVLVPILYLTQKTIDTRRVNGHSVELVSGTSTYNSFTINDGLLKTFRDNTIIVSEKFLNRGVIESEGDLEIIADIFENMSATMSSKGSIDIIANDISHKTLVYQYNTPNGFSSKAGKIASISANGNIRLISDGSITVEGALIASDGSILFNANDDIFISSIQLSSGSSGVEGGFDFTRSQIANIASVISAKDTIMLLASGLIEIKASELIADEGFIKILAGMGVYIGNEFNQFQSSRSGEVGHVTLHEEQFRTIAIRSALEAGRGVLIATEFGDLTLQATRIKSGEGATLNAGNGSINLLLAKEQDHFYKHTVNENFWRIKTETIEDTVDSAVYNSITGGVKLQTSHSINIELGQYEGQTIDNVLNSFKSNPELIWMNEVYDNPEYNTQINTIYQQLVEIHNYDKTRNLSPAAMAIIAIAVAVVLGPVAGVIGTEGALTATATFGLAEGTVATVATAAMQAGLSTIVTQATQSLAAGNSLDTTLKVLSSKDSVTSLATSMVTAGAMSGLSAEFGFEFFDVAETSTDGLFTANNMAQLGNQSIELVIKSAIKAGVSLAFNGDNEFDKLFLQMLKTDAVNTLGSGLAHKIESFSRAGDIGTALQYISHAGVGCLTGTLSTDQNQTQACLGGAAGSAVATWVSNSYDHQIDSLTDDEQKLRAVLLKRFGLNPENPKSLEIMQQLMSKHPNQSEFELGYKVLGQWSELRKELASIKGLAEGYSRLTSAVALFVVGASADAINAGDSSAENVSQASVFREKFGLAFLNYLDETEQIRILGTDSSGLSKQDIELLGMSVPSGFTLQQGIRYPAFQVYIFNELAKIEQVAKKLSLSRKGFIQKVRTSDGLTILELDHNVTSFSFNYIADLTVQQKREEAVNELMGMIGTLEMQKKVIISESMQTDDGVMSQLSPYALDELDYMSRALGKLADDYHYWTTISEGLDNLSGVSAAALGVAKALTGTKKYADDAIEAAAELAKKLDFNKIKQFVAWITDNGSEFLSAKALKIAQLKGNHQEQSQEIISVILEFSDRTGLELSAANLEGLTQYQLLLQLDEVVGALPITKSQFSSLSEVFESVAQHGNLMDDPELLTNYQAYIARKTAAGLAYRDAYDYIKTTERFAKYTKKGNDFNRLAESEQWHKYNEVTVSRPPYKGANGKVSITGRMDSIDIVGDITPDDWADIIVIERKYTDLDNYSLAQFRYLLKDIQAKYPVLGMESRAAKYNGLPGVNFNVVGYNLEIPDFNLNSVNYSAFVTEAKAFGFSITTRPST